MVSCSVHQPLPNISPSPLNQETCSTIKLGCSNLHFYTNLPPQPPSTKCSPRSSFSSSSNNGSLLPPQTHHQWRR